MLNRQSVPEKSATTHTFTLLSTGFAWVEVSTFRVARCVTLTSPASQPITHTHTHTLGYNALVETSSTVVIYNFPLESFRHQSSRPGSGPERNKLSSFHIPTRNKTKQKKRIHSKQSRFSSYEQITKKRNRCSVT